MIYLLVADKEEAKYIKKNIPNTKIIITGIGQTNVIKSLLNFTKNHIITKNDRFINIGYCGTNLDNVEVGSLLRVDKVERFTQPKFLKEKPIVLGRSPLKVTCYSADDFVTETTYKGIFDMELYTMALFFPSISSFKIVSDKLNLKQYESKKKRLKTTWNIVNQLLIDMVA